MTAGQTTTDCFVIGAMKAGTTAMCDWLAVQPGIAVSVPKEPGIFISDEAADTWAERRFALYPDAQVSTARVEGSTDYAKFPTISGVPERVRRHNPAARFVYMMRDPVARTISQYRFEWLMGGDSLSFDRALETNPGLVDYSRYAFQLQQWLQVFPPERFLLVFAEEFAREPADQVRRVLGFLDLPSDDGVVVPPDTRSNQTDQLVRDSLARRLLRDSAFGRVLRPHVPDAVTRTYKRRLAEKSQPDVTAGRRAALTQTFDADLHQLSRLTGGPQITCAIWADTTTTWTPQLLLS